MQRLKKYQFHIKTRTGIVVKPICISATSQLTAEQNLFQMYRDCQIIDVCCLHQRSNTEIDYQEVLDLIINT